jgi:hypothetical protein
MAHGNELSDALALEAIELTRSMNDARAEAHAELGALGREMAAKGSFNSGGVMPSKWKSAGRLYPEAP